MWDLVGNCTGGFYGVLMCGRAPDVLLFAHFHQVPFVYEIASKLQSAFAVCSAGRHSNTLT